MDLGNICTNPNVLTVFLIIKYTFNIVCVIVPIILMIRFIFIFAPVIISGEKLNETVSKLVKSAIAAIAVFLLPSIMKFVFTDIIDLSSLDITQCFTNSTVEKIEHYREVEKQKAEEEAKKRLEEQKKANEERNEKEQNIRDQLKVEREEYQGLPGYGTVFVGDSRTVQYSYQLQLRDTDKLFATGGGAMNEFQIDINKALSHISANSSHRYNLVLNYGVNNLSQDWVGAYQNTINRVNGKADILIVSINPCGKGKCNNTRISEVNAKLKNEFSSGYVNVKYCDTYSEFTKRGNFDNLTTDGVHYNNDGANLIYNKINECLKEF